MGNLKLATKIIFGFGTLIAITLALGGLGIFGMRHVEGDVVRLAKEYVPQVTVANEVERAALKAMLEIRSYGLSGEAQYLSKGRELLAQVDRQVEAATEHARQHAELTQLKDNAAKAGAKAKEYGQFVERTVAGEERKARLLEAMGRTGAVLVKNGQEFLDHQLGAARKEAAAGGEAGRLESRLESVALISGVIDLGNAVRLANVRAQLLRQPEEAREALKSFGEIARKLDGLKRLSGQGEDMARLEAIAAASQQYEKAMREFMADWQGAQEMIRTRTAVAEEVLAAAQATAQDGVRQTNDLAAEALGSLAKVSGQLLAGVAVALGLGALLALLLTRAITRPIHAVITGLGEGSSQVSAAAGQVSATSQQLAEGSSEQAAAVEQTSASMEEMAAITKQNADNAGQADQLVGDVNQVVARANQAMAELTQAMADISRAGEDTGKIVKTIDEIAFQTNLLALNAAVEAARAGEAGAGFAVVAEEVRNLARRAAEAAKSTSVLITGTIRKTKEGSELVQRTNQAFGEVSARAAKVADLVGEIAAASAEQAQGIDQVNRALNEMDKVTQRNASSAEESASASEELAAQAETMQGCVTQLIHLVGQGRGGNGLDGNGLGGARREEPRALLTAARSALSRRQGGRELDD